MSMLGRLSFFFQMEIMCAMSLSSQQQLGSALLKHLLGYSFDEVSHGDGAQTPLSRVEGIPQILLDAFPFLTPCVVPFLCSHLHISW
jgi:hypothetical protein